MLLGSSLLFGSASIFSGTKQHIKIESDPSGATIEIDGVEMGKTHLSLMLRKNEYEIIKLRKDGYEIKTLTLEKHFDPVALLDILWDFSTTDFLTGAVYEYSPNSYYVELKKKATN